MNIFEITIQRKTDEGWPAVVEHSQAGSFLPVRNEGRLAMDKHAYAEHLLSQVTPMDYGIALGKALFRDEVRDAFTRARAESGDDLRLLLFVEDEELKTLHWERLCAPLDGGWKFLALDQRVVFSLYLPSLTDRRFPPFGRRDLRALIVAANPRGLEDFGLAPFNAVASVAGVQSALGEIPSDVLADVPGAVGPPTLDALVERLTAERYTLLHVVAHGSYARRSGDTILHLAKATPDTAGDEVDPVPGERFIERLGNLRGARGLPHFAFLSTCESASPEAESGLGGLAQRLVRELGMPAVLAMSEPVTIPTAQALAARFYAHLREDGEPDRALVEATAGLAERGDITVPALYSRLGGRPLFSDALDRALTDAEIEFGLAELEKTLPERAPVLQEELAKAAAALRGKLGAERAALSLDARDEWEAALPEVNTLCEEVLDLSFNALALGQEPPAYDPRCPFPGLLAFGVRFLASGKEEQDDREFFFGREKLIAQLARKLADHNFLPVLGPSGSGKSSLVLAGLVPALQESESGLQMAYMTPGFDPPAQLETSLSSHTDQPIILVVDQFEELFTLCTDKEVRRVFLDRLLAISEQLPVVITMRADFWGECAAYRGLAQEMQAHQVLIPPMDGTELRRAVEQQASAVGLRFEADLVYTMLDAVRDEPGAMPLLQHLLRLLWERRHGRWLRAAEYRAIGGVHQAIAHTAEAAYAQSLAEEKDRLQDIFVRLTWLHEDDAPAEDWRDTRRRVSMDELVPARSDPAMTKALVNRLADARLVVTSESKAADRAEVEVAHEALIRYWPRLRDWLDKDREILRVREGIRRAALEWEKKNRDDGYLLHQQERLADAETLIGHPRFALNELEQAYLDACAAVHTEELLLELRSAVAQREPAVPFLERLRIASGRRLIQQLEEPHATDLIPGSHHPARDELRDVLGVRQVTPTEQPGNGEETFGPVAMSAVSHQEWIKRQAAALALVAVYQAAAVGRLRAALARWEREAQPGRWQRLWRKAEIRGNLADNAPKLENEFPPPGLRDRAAIWFWRVWRRLLQDRHRMGALTLGGGMGAGLGLALLRGATAPAAGLTASLQFGVSSWWGLILGAALTFGLLLPEVLVMERDQEDEQLEDVCQSLSRSKWQSVILGTLGFGTAHFLIAGATGYHLLDALLLVNLAALLMGLGISVGLYGQSWCEDKIRAWRWLIRLVPVVAGATLGQIIIYRADQEWSTAVGAQGDNYRSQLAGIDWQWWQHLIEQNPGWYRAFGLMDAILVGVVLFLGIVTGVRLSARWIRRWRLTL